MACATCGKKNPFNIQPPSNQNAVVISPNPNRLPSIRGIIKAPQTPPAPPVEQQPVQQPPQNQ